MNISFLDKIISSEDVAVDDQPALGEIDLEDKTSRITALDQRLTLLERISERHQLLTVELEHYDIQFSSLILEINEEEAYLVLDEFYPVPEPGLIQANTRVKFYTFLSGVQVDFSSTIVDTAGELSRPYYKIPIPEVIHYYQNRQYLRVPVSISHPIRVVLSDNKSVVTNGEIRDISAGGFSARLKLMEQRFSVGEIIPRCILYMPGDKKIFCCIEVRQSQPANLNLPPKIGAGFRDIRKSDQKSIERFVAKIDRDLTRRFSK
ncbi:MAG: flagellar brake protein [Thiotrichales bacterium]|nr:flagellar brake protein [Thiotrichales bacterium]